MKLYQVDRIYTIIFSLALLLSTQAANAAEGLAAALYATAHQNPAIHGKRAEVAAKVFASESARAQRYPSVSGQGGRRFQRVASQGGQSLQLNAVTLRIRQPLWAFGRIDDGIAYADADHAASNSDLLRVKRKLLENTASAYAAVVGVQQRLALGHANVTEHEELFQRVERRRKGGLASKTDSLIAEVRLRQARADIFRMDGELSATKNDLFTLTQKPVEVGARVDERWLKLPEQEQIESALLQADADVQQKQAMVKLAKSGLDQSWSASMPTVYAQAERSFNLPGYIQGTQYSIMMEGSVDGMGFMALGRYKASNSKLTAAQFDLTSTKNDVLRQARVLMNDRQMQQALIESLDLSIHALKETLDSYRRQQNVGYKKWMDVLNLQKEYYDQRNLKIQAQTSQLTSTLRLMAMLGNFDGVAE